MAISNGQHHARWRLCPLWHSTGTSSSSSSSSTRNLYGKQSGSHDQRGGGAVAAAATTVSSVAKSILPARRRLRLDPSSNLYFPYEPGKQVRSAVRIKNMSKSHVVFKFQTTAPKSCFMRPPGGVLGPGEGIIATVFKFVEHPESNEKPTNRKSKVKFKIMSLKVSQGTDYVPELFDEQRDEVTVERVLRVVFLDPGHTNPALEKLKRQLAEADAAIESSRKKPQLGSEARARAAGDQALVIDEWKERREKYLARQQVDST